ncbi:hypothetical protein LSH36_177g04001 [Paralvinella palmiformis]|uniref:Uncharacterized protein n=1 Tax=Paralvinella palmiformis TaxID=53620 RepID=A0AAD9JRZ6_9ANNE|nr:hypothetical protein LSH36_177g04001 [Paralvinella palmiformis]
MLSSFFVEKKVRRIQNNLESDHLHTEIPLLIELFFNGLLFCIENLSCSFLLSERNVLCCLKFFYFQNIE